MNINSIMELVIILTILQTIPVIANFTRPAEGFIADGINAVVDELNKIRSQLALGNFTTQISKGYKQCPSATRMLKMKWDPEVAAIAQAYVNTWDGNSQGLPPKGDPGLVEVQYYASKNENERWNNTEYQLLAAAGIGHIFKVYVNGFFNYLRYFNEAVFLMDETSGVGCGIAEVERLKPNVYALVLCYFTPRQLAYKEGKTCSECPDGTKCEESTGLCEDIEDIEKEASSIPTGSTLNDRSAGVLGAEGIKAIVDTVNEFRSQVALGNVSWNGAFWPSATNMLKVKWDPESPGFFHHEQGHKWARKATDPEYVEFATNLFKKYVFNDLTSKRFTNDLSNILEKKTIMADTSGVGCSIVETIGNPPDVAYSIKCYLTPRRFIYKEGETCSECPLGTKCQNSTGLCEEDPSSSDATKKISFGLYFLYFLTFYSIHLL